MNKNLNRRKFYLNKKFYFFCLIFFIILFFIYLIFTHKNYILKKAINSIENFSNNYEYQYIKKNIDGLSNVEKSYINNILKKYFKTSIFLLPLDKINDEIKENNWIKNVKLKTNYKDTLYINIEEYVPIGLYEYAQKLFYFDKNGKIIEEYNKNSSNDNSNLIIFSGKYSNLKAHAIMDILNETKFLNRYKIQSITYINNRRWNIYIYNNIKLMLSENNINKSILNFIDIEKNLSKDEINKIKYFDLRNINKTLIAYK